MLILTFNRDFVHAALRWNSPFPEITVNVRKFLLTREQVL